MNKRSPPPSRKAVSLAVAQLMPQILRGVQLDFFVKRGVIPPPSAAAARRRRSAGRPRVAGSDAPGGGITQTQFLVLASIRAFSRCPMGILARSLHVTMPTVSGIVDRLVRAHLVRRAPHPTDRRQVMVELTAKGQAFLTEFQGIVRRRWEEVLRSLHPTELQAFYRVITKLREQLQRTIR